MYRGCCPTPGYCLILAVIQEPLGRILDIVLSDVGERLTTTGVLDFIIAEEGGDEDPVEEAVGQGVANVPACVDVLCPRARRDAQLREPSLRNSHPGAVQRLLEEYANIYRRLGGRRR